MIKFKLSRNVRSGDVVSLRGDKFIRCSSRSKIAGVWNDGCVVKMLTLNGENKYINMPSGVQYFGKANIGIWVDK